MQEWWQRSERVRWVFMVLAVMLVVWEIAVRLLGARTFILPAPTVILNELAAYPNFYLKHSLYTLGITGLGFLIAAVGGVLLAVGIVYSRFLDRVLSAFLVSFNAVPKVALAPLFVIWMGTASQPKIAIAVMIAIFPIVIDSVLGLRSVDPEQINLARSCRASAFKTLWKIRLPNALPSIFSGLKVGVSFALIGAIVGEFVAGNTGLGSVILLAQGNFDTPRVFAALLLLGVLGTILFYLIDLAETLLLPWHVSQRGPGGQLALGGDH
jgi:NitT/TauT family transport system permease protein